MKLKVILPAQASGGNTTTSNNALSDRSHAAKIRAGQQPIQSNGQLEVIHQASREEGSPLVKVKLLNIDNSEESFALASPKAMT